MKLEFNTKNSGIVRIIIYPSRNKYIAVCLDFDIIEEAETIKEAKAQIGEAVFGYIENAQKNNLDDKLLNRHAPEKYWRIFREYEKLLFPKDETRIKVSKDIRNSSLFSIPINELSEMGVCSLL